MKYMLMLFDNEDWWNTGSEAEIAAEMELHNAFARYLQEHDLAILGGDALRQSATATTLRGAGDALTVTDGPFVELKEQIGGYYVIEAPDIETAVEAARHCPLGSGIEVRPIPDVG